MPKSSSIPGNAVHALLPTTLLVISLILLLVTLTPVVRAQTFTVLHDFTGGDDGGAPWSGLTRGPHGSFYGTTWSGGQRSSDCVDSGCGTLFQLSKSGSGWDYSVLHTFMGGSDGAGPWARVVFGPNGILFGTTSAGGVGGCQIYGDHLGCGTVFRMVPPDQVGPYTRPHMASMSITTIYTFLNGADGAAPGFGDLIFDPAGNMYGTTIVGGVSGWGAVYEISPSGQGWTEQGLYSFSGATDGGLPYAGVLRDGRGNLYGATTVSGDDPLCWWGGMCGVLFQLVPSAGGWTDNTIFTFHNNGAGTNPVGSLISDGSGNLYGSTSSYSGPDGGTVFVLQPQQNGWSLTVLCSFNAGGSGPYANLVMGVSGDLYGTTYADGEFNAGTVFKVSHSSGGWTCTSLHDFTGASDGGLPVSSVSIDGQGNLYGTASSGGAYGQGVIWEITP